MVAKEFMLIAGDADNDRLAAALVSALRQQLTSAETGYEEGFQPLHASLDPRFYGAGGPMMADAGVELICETAALQTAQAHPIRRRLVFRRVFDQLYRLALAREPHAIVFVGFFGFNLRCARAIRHYVAHREGTFYNWDPRIIQLGAPPAWPTRPARVRQAGKVMDLLLSTDPSEKAGYAKSAPNLRVEFVGQTNSPSEIAAAAGRATRCIVQLVMGSESHFPLRAYLSSP